MHMFVGEEEGRWEGASASSSRLGALDIRAAGVRSARQHLASRVSCSWVQPYTRSSQSGYRCFMSTFEIAIGLRLPGHCCGNCSPRSGFLSPQSSGATVAVQSWAVLGVTTAWVQMPTQSRNTASPPSERPVAATEAFALSQMHDSPGHSLFELGWWRRKRLSRLLDRHTLSLYSRRFASIALNGHQRICISHRSSFCNVCDAAVMLHKSPSCPHTHPVRFVCGNSVSQCVNSMCPYVPAVSVSLCCLCLSLFLSLSLSMSLSLCSS